MTKKKKTFLIIIAIIIACALFSPYAVISRYVHRNYGNLIASSEFYLERGAVNQSGDETMDVEGIYGDTNKIVQFYYGGFGLAPSSTYYGFYYSPNDVAVPYMNDNYELVEKANDEWFWEGEGDNGGTIKKITDHFYYYKAWF